MSSLWLLFFLSLAIILSRNTASCMLNKFLHDKNPQYVDLVFPVPKKTKEGNESGDHWYLESGEAPTLLTYGKNVEEIPIEKRIVALVVVDISSKVNGNPDYIATLEDVKSSIDNVTLEQIKKWPTFIVFKLGWSRYYYDDKSKYLGISNNESQARLPGTSPELIKWVVSKEGGFQIVGIGTDYPAVKNIKDEHRYARQSKLEAGLYLIEGLNLETTVPTRECTVIISPLKVQNTTETFVNVLAICPGDSQDEHYEEDEHGSEHKCECKTHEKPESNKNNDHSESDVHSASSSGHKSHKCKKHIKHEHETTEKPDEQVTTEKPDQQVTTEKPDKQVTTKQPDKQTTENMTEHKHEHQTDKPPKQTPATSSPPVKPKPDRHDNKDNSLFPGPIGNFFKIKDKLKL